MKNLNHQSITFYQVKDEHLSSKKKRQELVKSPYEAENPEHGRVFNPSDNIFSQNEASREIDTPCFEKGMIFTSGGSFAGRKQSLNA